MASRAIQPQPFETLLAALPSLPRLILSRLVARMIEHLDHLDGDPDLEPEMDYGIDDVNHDGDPWEHLAYGEDQSLGPIMTFCGH